MVCVIFHIYVAAHPRKSEIFGRLHDDYGSGYLRELMLSHSLYKLYIMKVTPSWPGCAVGYDHELMHMPQGNENTIGLVLKTTIV